MENRDSRRISALYLSGVEECKKAGVDLTPEAYAEIWEAAKKAIAPGLSVPAFLQLPARVGSVTLWPITIGASLWWKECGKGYFEGEKESDQLVALAWMLAHAREPTAFDAATSRREAAKAIRKWLWKEVRGVTLAELAVAVGDVLGWDDGFDGGDLVEAGSGEGSSIDWGEYLASLCGGYHRPPEYFLWCCGAELVEELARKMPSPFGEVAKSADSTGFFRFRKTIERIKSSTAKGTGEGEAAV